MHIILFILLLLVIGMLFISDGVEYDHRRRAEDNTQKILNELAKMRKDDK